MEVYVPNTESKTLMDHFDMLINKDKHARYQISKITTNPEFKTAFKKSQI